MSGYSESSVFAVLPTEGVFAVLPTDGVVVHLWSPLVSGNSISSGGLAPWSGPYIWWGDAAFVTTMMWGGSQQWASRGSYGGTSQPPSVGKLKTSIFTAVGG